MKKIVLFLSFTGALALHSQNVLFEDNFESGGTDWTLNNGVGDNQWIVNNIFAGDGFGGIIIVPTPNQPATFTGGINSNYLHIHNQPVCGTIACNANFDTGSSSDQTATMTSSINTIGMNNINLNFWYLCAGAQNVTYGFVEYSTNGSNWTQIGSPLSGVSTWTQINLTNPALSNQATLKFRLHWINGASGNDPAFSVDELKITGVNSNQTSITTSTPSVMSACFGSVINLSVPFSATGNYVAGNTFTAELSDANGSFASPLSIGTLNSTSSGNQTITATIASGTPVGSGYRIRVVSSSPATIGADNGQNLEIFALPFINITSNPANGVITQGQSISLMASGGATYLWSPAAIVSSTVGASVTAAPTVSSIVSVVGTDQNGCSSSSVFNITVNPTSSISEEEKILKLVISPNPASEYFVITNNSSKPIEKVIIKDVNGKKVKSFDNPQSDIFLVNDLPTGQYFVVAKVGSATKTIKLIVR